MKRRPLLLDDEGLKRLYAEAAQDDKAEITKDTQLILDVCRLHLNNCQSLIIDKRRGKLFTQTSTNSLVKKFVSWQNFNFAPATFIMSKLHPGKAPRHAVPFVAGETVLLPFKGYSREAGHWIFKKNLIDYTCLGTDRIGLQFRCGDCPNYTIIEKCALFERVYRDAELIAYVQAQLISQLLRDFTPHFIKSTEDQIRQKYPEYLGKHFNFATEVTAWSDQLIEHVLQYNGSLIDEMPSAQYIIQVKEALHSKYQRLR